MSYFSVKISVTTVFGNCDNKWFDLISWNMHSFVNLIIGIVIITTQYNKPHKPPRSNSSKTASYQQTIKTNNTQSRSWIGTVTVKHGTRKAGLICDWNYKNLDMKMTLKNILRMLMWYFEYMYQKKKLFSIFYKNLDMILITLIYSLYICYVHLCDILRNRENLFSSFQKFRVN